jgi:hypothetical protein
MDKCTYNKTTKIQENSKSARFVTIIIQIGLIVKQL